MSPLLQNTIDCGLFSASKSDSSNALQGDRFDAEKRERKFIASDETPVIRYSWWDGEYMLIVSHKPGDVDLSRVGENGSAMFIQDHRQYSQSGLIGKLIDAKIKSGQLEVTARINNLTPGNEYIQLVQDGCEPGKSIGFDPHETEMVSEAKYEKGKLVELPVYKLVSWSLHEVSTVVIPAIGSVGFSQKTGFSAYESREQERAERNKQLQLFGKHLPRKRLADLLI